MKESTLIRLPLQFFAEGEAPAPAAQTDTAAATPTFDDVLKDKTMQSEFDKRMSKAIETAKEKWDAEAKVKAEEAAKLAKMTADEKAKHEREQQEKKLADREAAVTRRELTAEAIKQLAEKNKSCWDK